MGVDEKGIDPSTGKVLIEISPRYFRPAEVDILRGDASRAAKGIGWTAKTKARELCELMVAYDLQYDDYGADTR